MDKVQLKIEKSKIYRNLDILDILDDRERKSLSGGSGWSSVGEERTQREIAKELGISRSYVSLTSFIWFQKMEAKSMTLIQLEHVSKNFVMGGETIRALDDISLEIDHGEFVAIMGPSGSGKSTLINILGCLDVADHGAYVLDGKAINQMKDAQLAEIRNRKIGFVFQSFNLLPRLNAYENVELPLIYRGMSKREREPLVMQALEAVDVADRRRHLPSELSGGQQQRVAILRTLAGDFEHFQEIE
ncbi:ABC-type lipoprotein export system, ATPase component [Paenibacillus sp. yr247]|nr:ABC-type lipoprotein export system, ATPase component [Paenibacillus sp. yr247]